MRIETDMTSHFFLADSNLQIASAVLRISGPDANTYLQGQFTQDVRLKPQNFCYGLWLNQKGKVLADSYILRENTDQHLVFAPRTEAAVLRERLDAYLIADEVDIIDESTTWLPAYWWCEAEAGPAVNALSLAGLDWPAPPAFARVDGAWLFQIAGAPVFTLALLIPAEARDAWRARLQTTGATEADWAEAELARIQAGRIAVPDDVGATDLPNEAGLETSAISYTKGCYLGQEVMSRLKNLGQVRRKLLRVRGPGEPPPRGATLSQAGQRVGEMRSAARSGDGFVGFAMLSLIALDAAQPIARAPEANADIVIDHG